MYVYMYIACITLSNDIVYVYSDEDTLVKEVRCRQYALCWNNHTWHKGVKQTRSATKV